MGTDAGWMYPQEHPAPDGDFTQKQRKIVQLTDPGVEGSLDMVGSAVTGFEKRLFEEGDLPLNVKQLQPPEWSKMTAGLEVLNATAYNYYGTQVVNTNRGIQPFAQFEYIAGYDLPERPRRVALLVMDIMVDYIPFVGYLIPKARQVVEKFREKDLPVFWSNYLRRSNDKMYGALDRFYGPRGVKSTLNPMYVYAQNGGDTVPELAPTDAEVEQGRVLKSGHLGKFADVDETGRSIFAQKLQKLGVDTLFIVGSWTEDCVLATTTAAVDDYNIDVVLVSDGVGTATPDHFAALQVMKSSWAKVLSANEATAYLENADPKQLWDPARKLGQFPYAASALSVEQKEEVAEDLLSGFSVEHDAVGARVALEGDVLDYPNVHYICVGVFLAFILGNLSGFVLARFVGKRGIQNANVLREPLLASTVA
jgi:nicotinamidase-related amidase